MGRGWSRGTWIAFCTIVRREMVRFFRIWPQTFLPPVITITLYFLVFGKFIGQYVSKINGYSYTDFIMPGLVMMSVIMNSYNNVVSSFYGARFQRNIEEMLIAPVPESLLILGYVVGGSIRGLITGCMVIAVSLFFTGLKLHSHDVIITLGVVILAAVLFSLVGFFNGLFARKFDDVTIIPTFILTPLIYLGGVFYSISNLSGIWQTLSKANPILYLVNAFRYGMLGLSDVHIEEALFVAGGFVVGMFLLNLFLIKKGVGLKP